MTTMASSTDLLRLLMSSNLMVTREINRIVAHRQDGKPIDGKPGAFEVQIDPVHFHQLLAEELIEPIGHNLLADETYRVSAKGWIALE